MHPEAQTYQPLTVNFLRLPGGPFVPRYRSCCALITRAGFGCFETNVLTASDPDKLAAALAALVDCDGLLIVDPAGRAS